MDIVLPSPLQQLNFPNKQAILVYIKRDDLIHPDISGNKWRKLKYNIEEAKKQCKNTLLTFGGAYSNHIRATAATANMLGLKSIGIIRGEELNEKSNENLKYASEQDMKLLFIDRETYFKRNEPHFIGILKERFSLPTNDFFIVPEGGANLLGAKGCEDILKEIEIDFDYIITACGTGTTLAGLTQVIPSPSKAIGISVLKDSTSIDRHLKQLTTSSFELIEDYHFGGYAKRNQELINFIRSFQSNFGIPLDYVYTGKMMYGLFDLINKGYFKPNSKIIALHTGGVANAGVG